MKITLSNWFLASVISTVTFLLGFGYYLEYYSGLVPCPLCVLQRFCYFGILLSAFACFLAKGFPRILVTSHYTILSFTLLGSLIASRQVWLQRFASKESLECIPSLKFLIENLPLQETIYKLYIGGSDCATVNWMFLGASIADWSLLFFLGLFISTASFISRRPLKR